MDKNSPEFTWQVAETGYDWVEAVPFPSDVRARFITDGQQIGRARRRQYAPLQVFTGLFRMFAETEATEDGIKLFADRFGLLGHKQHQIETDDGRMVFGELADSWEIEIEEMREAVAIWDIIEGGDVAGLAKYVTWNGDSVEVQGRNRASASMADVVVRLAAIQPGDLVNPAQFYIREVVNKRLVNRVSPRLVSDPTTFELAVAILPDSLLGGLWLQFAQAIDQNKAFRACERCGLWFEIGPGASRSDRKFCSPTCRVRKHRERQTTSAEKEK